MRTSNLGLVCGCAECIEWGVATEPQRRVPASVPRGFRWIHGRELSSWLKAKANFERAARAAVGPNGRRQRMERLTGDGQ